MRQIRHDQLARFAVRKRLERFGVDALEEETVFLNVESILPTAFSRKSRTEKSRMFPMEPYFYRKIFLKRIPKRDTGRRRRDADVAEREFAFQFLRKGQEGQHKFRLGTESVHVQCAKCLDRLLHLFVSRLTGPVTCDHRGVGRNDLVYCRDGSCADAVDPALKSKCQSRTSKSMGDLDHLIAAHPHRVKVSGRKICLELHVTPSKGSQETILALHPGDLVARDRPVRAGELCP